MSGGVWEYTMGQIVENESTNIGVFYLSPSSGTWNEIPQNKY